LSTPSEFDVRVDTASPGVVVVRLFGDLDMGTCPRAESAISSAPSAARVIVDLTKCTFVDSSGVRALMEAHRKLTSEGGRVELVAADAGILRVLEITNASTVLPVHSTLETAL
jgi:anti-sigma B factor antagonist